MSNCGFSNTKVRPRKDYDELYECDGCDLVGEAFEFELADKDGQLCSECVLDSF
jgi:hypothetical protein